MCASAQLNDVRAVSLSQTTSAPRRVSHVLPDVCTNPLTCCTGSPLAPSATTQDSLARVLPHASVDEVLRWLARGMRGGPLCDVQYNVYDNEKEEKDDTAANGSVWPLCRAETRRAALHILRRRAHGTRPSCSFASARLSSHTSGMSVGWTESARDRWLLGILEHYGVAAREPFHAVRRAAFALLYRVLQPHTNRRSRLRRRAVFFFLPWIARHVRRLLWLCRVGMEDAFAGVQVEAEGCVHALVALAVRGSLPVEVLVTGLLSCVRRWQCGAQAAELSAGRWAWLQALWRLLAGSRKGHCRAGGVCACHEKRVGTGVGAEDVEENHALDEAWVQDDEVYSMDDDEDETVCCAGGYYDGMFNARAVCGMPTRTVRRRVCAAMCELGAQHPSRAVRRLAHRMTVILSQDV